MNDTDRDLRQRDLIPRERLNATTATVIGVGAIGRQVALQLAALGVGRLTLMDPQTVETVNLAPQAYFELDVNQLKVLATAQTCRQLNSAVKIDAAPRRFTRSSEVGDVVFACVDAIDTRRLIYESVRQKARLLIDGRMAAEVVRVLAVPLTDDSAWYCGTLFNAAEAYPESCTARSTVYAANLAAALMVHQFTRWLRGIPTEPDQILNLLAGELACGVTV
jgi:molybdopterin/thiamine biosynthesis adenylyltransferase